MCGAPIGPHALGATACVNGEGQFNNNPSNSSWLAPTTPQHSHEIPAVSEVPKQRTDSVYARGCGRTRSRGRARQGGVPQVRRRVNAVHQDQRMWKRQTTPQNKATVVGLYQYCRRLTRRVHNRRNFGQVVPLLRWRLQPRVQGICSSRARILQIARKRAGRSLS